MVIGLPARSEMTPFLNWAGGKRWLVDYLKELIPREFHDRRYVEPFLGSGAVYFGLLPNKALLGDSNKRLIETYVVVRNNWRDVLNRLQIHHSKHSKDYYYLQRSVEYSSPADRAAQFIYLNRTCWNGLYRVNTKGKFNVPVGTKKSVLLPTDDFAQVARQLKKARIESADFEELIHQCGHDDLIYVDPPYTILHENNGFLKYNEKIFSWEDQIRLRDALLEAKNRGSEIIVSNAHHVAIVELYKQFGKIIKLQRKTRLAADSSKRGMGDELLIATWLE